MVGWLVAMETVVVILKHICDESDSGCMCHLTVFTDFFVSVFLLLSID